MLQWISVDQRSTVRTTTQDKEKMIQDFFQPHLIHNSMRSEVITASIAWLKDKDFTKL